MLQEIVVEVCDEHTSVVAVHAQTAATEFRTVVAQGAEVACGLLCHLRALAIPGRIRQPLGGWSTCFSPAHHPLGTLPLATAIAVTPQSVSYFDLVRWRDRELSVAFPTIGDDP